MGLFYISKMARYNVSAFSSNLAKAKVCQEGASYGAYFVGKCPLDLEPAKAFFNGTKTTLQDGTPISFSLKFPGGVRGNGCFDPGLYFEKLKTLHFGRLLCWAPVLPSTQSLLSENFKVLPLGIVCVADIQSQGKGRGANIWDSPLGCLMFSFTLQMENGRVLPFLQYVASLAIIEAIESILTEKRLPSLPIKIKWPNDIYANGVKIGGILCTSTYSDKMFNVVVGIGLNVGNKKPTVCLNSLLMDLVAEAPLIRREELLSSFFDKFEILLKVLIEQGFAPLKIKYYEKWLHSGQRVVLDEKCSEGNLISSISLTIQGLSSTGYLLAVDDNMEEYELHPDGNRFDFLKGLIKRKISS